MTARNRRLGAALLALFAAGCASSGGGVRVARQAEIRQDYDRAVVEYSRALQADPNDADARTGVIDMYGGPSEEFLAHWPTRVIPLGDAESLFIFTALQYPGVPDEDFAAQCQGLEREFPHIKAHVEAAHP